MNIKDGFDFLDSETCDGGQPVIMVFEILPLATQVLCLGEVKINTLNKCGVYKHVYSRAFEILLLGVSINGGEVQAYDLEQGETVLMEVINALMNDAVLKWAFNALFGRVCS